MQFPITQKPPDWYKDFWNNVLGILFWVFFNEFNKWSNVDIEKTIYDGMTSPPKMGYNSRIPRNILNKYYRWLTHT